MRGQEQEEEEQEEEEKYVGLGTWFSSLQPCGFVTSNKHETACCCLLVR